MESLLNETAWQRANKDTMSAFHTFRFWLFDLLAGAIFTLLVLLWTPSWVSNEWKIIYQVIVPVFVILVGLALLYLVSLIKAPYKQRNEARQRVKELEKAKNTPLVVECYSYGKTLVGKTYLNEHIYLWSLDVMLTNTSDIQEVSTKLVSLQVHYPNADGNVGSYLLSLISDNDKGKYGNKSGRIFVENEYLRHRESMRGYYQFLDEENFWKPKSMQTWPTLVVVDSFNANHRIAFNRPSWLTQANYDKGDSQNE